MSKATVGIIIAGIVIVLAAGFVWYTAAQQAPEAQPTTGTSPAASSDDTTDEQSNDSDSNQRAITFTDTGFTPSNLTIKAGDTVTIKNESQASVQFSSDDHPTHRNHPEMNMQMLQPGEETQLTIAKPGTYPYHDHINDRYTGTIIVTN